MLIVVASQLEKKNLPERLLAEAGSAVLVTGVGPRAVAVSLAQLRKPDSRVLILGLAGALVPDAKCGDIIMATEVVTEQNEVFNLKKIKLKNEHRQGRVFSSSHVLETSIQREKWQRHSNAIAVEMEAASVLNWASCQKLPVAMIRVISDEFDDSLEGLNSCLSQAGTWNAGAWELWKTKNASSAKVLSARLAHALQVLSTLNFLV